MAVDADRLPKLLHGLDAGEHSSEVAVLATCNRTEVYLIAERFHGTYDEVRDFFADLTYLPDPFMLMIELYASLLSPEAGAGAEGRYVMAPGALLKVGRACRGTRACPACRAVMVLP